MFATVRRSKIERFSAFTALAVLAACAVASTRAFGTECHDVRTGRAFAVSTARYTTEGVVLPDSALLGRLCVGALRATYAVPIGDGAGGASVVWIEPAGADCDLRVQHVVASGEPAAGWPEGGRVLCAARGTQTQPVIVNANDGGLWLAWKDYRDPQRSAVYFARLDPQGVPIAGFPADGLRVSAVTESASDPALITQGAGDGSGAFLIWQQGRSGVRRLLLSHYDDGGALTAGWPAEGRVLVDSLQNAVRPMATRDQAGGFILAWVAEGPGVSRLRLARFGVFGTLAAGWPTAGLEITSSTSHLQPLALAADTGGVYLTWSEANDDSSRVLLTHLLLTGAVHPDWPSGGRQIGSAGSMATSPALALDGTGGAYLAWADHTGESAAGDIRLERLGPGGASAAGWSADGVAVTSSASDESQPRLLALADGVLVSWSEGEVGDGGRGQGIILSAAMASLGALPELGTVEKWPDLVRLSWRVEGEAKYSVSVERRGADGAWLPLKDLGSDAKGMYVLDDGEVSAGELLTYRLRLRSSQLEMVTGEVRVDVPVSTPLAIRGLTVEGGVLHLAYSLPVRGESRFELFDVQGRRLLRDVRQNEHGGELKLTWRVPDGVRAGVFFARLTQSGTSRTRRFVLARR